MGNLTLRDIGEGQDRATLDGMGRDTGRDRTGHWTGHWGTQDGTRDETDTGWDGNGMYFR